MLTQATTSTDAGTPAAAVQADSAAQDYLPTTAAVRAQTLIVQGRTLHNLVVGGSRDGSTWRANLDADELNGYVEYRQAGARDNPAGRVFARLARLKLPQSAATQFEALLDEQPGTIPALDIVVDDFELRGRHLGRVEIEALNGGGDVAQREWRLAKFNIVTPEATFTGSDELGAILARIAAGVDQQRESQKA